MAALRNGTRTEGECKKEAGGPASSAAFATAAFFAAHFPLRKRRWQRGQSDVDTEADTVLGIVSGRRQQAEKWYMSSGGARRRRVDNWKENDSREGRTPGGKVAVIILVRPAGRLFDLPSPL